MGGTSSGGQLKNRGPLWLGNIGKGMSPPLFSCALQKSDGWREGRMWRGYRGSNGRWWGSPRPPLPTSPCPSVPLLWLLPCAAQAARGITVPMTMRLPGCKGDKSCSYLQTSGGRWERMQSSLHRPFPCQGLWLDSSAWRPGGSLWSRVSTKQEGFQWVCDKPCAWQALILDHKS